MQAGFIEQRRKIKELEEKLEKMEASIGDHKTKIEALRWKWERAAFLFSVVLLGAYFVFGVDPRRIAKDYVETEVPKFLKNEVPAIVQNEVPRLVSIEVAKQVQVEVPKLVKDEVPRLVREEIARFVKSEVPILVQNEVSKILNAEIPKLVQDEIEKFVETEIPKHVKDNAQEVVKIEIAKYAQVELPKLVADEVPKEIDRALKAVSADAALEKVRAIHAEVIRYADQIQATRRIAESTIASLNEKRRLEIDEVVTKEITIMSRDGKSKIGRISSDPVSSYLVTRPNAHRPYTSLRFEIGQNSQNGGSMIIRNSRASNDEETPTENPIGIEIRAWKNEAAVMLVNDAGQRVGNGTPGSLRWTTK